MNAPPKNTMDAARWMRHARERALGWLPVVVMLLAALATGWLVRNAPKLAQTRPTAAVTHDPDYQMQDFSVRTFDVDGHLLSQLRGAEAWHYPDVDMLEVSDPRWRALDKQQQYVITGHAKRAMAKGDGSEVELFDQAVVVRQPSEQTTGLSGRASQPVRFEGDYLRALVDDQQLNSDQPVTLQRGGDTFVGDRFNYDDTTGTATLRGRVRGVIQPASK